MRSVCFEQILKRHIKAKDVFVIGIILVKPCTGGHRRRRVADDRGRLERAKIYTDFRVAQIYARRNIFASLRQQQKGLGISYDNF